MGLMDGTGTRIQSVKPHINVHQRSCRNKCSLKAVSHHVQIRAFVYHAARCDGHSPGGFLRICVHSLRNLCGYVWAVVMLNAL